MMLRVLARDRDGHERSGSYNPAAPLGRGAFGAVYRDESLPGRVFKVYHGIVDPETLSAAAEPLDQQRRRELERKATAMLATAPQEERRAGRPTIAWPHECLYSGDGRFIGLAMEEIAEALPLDFVLTDALRAQRGLPQGYDYALSVGESLAAVVDQLHKCGHAVVDLTPLNVRVYRDDPEVALTGADKYRVNAGHTVYPARFLTDSIAAPELQKSAGARPDLAGEYQDRFALAFLIFQLLNEGATPFDAAGRGDFEPPAELSRRILDRLYPFGLKSHEHVAPPPASLHEHWPRHLREMFDAAFSAGNGSARPTPARWAETLRIMREQAKTCAVNPRGHGKARLEAREGPCVLCARDQKLGRTPSQAIPGSPQAAAIGAVRAAQAALKDARLPNLTVARLRVFGAAAVLAAVAAFLFLRPSPESQSAAADGGLVVVAKSDPASPAQPALVAPTAPDPTPDPALVEPPIAESAIAQEPSETAPQTYSVTPSSIERPTLRGYMRYAPRAASYTLAFNVDVNGKARDIVVERGAPQGYGFEEEARRLVAAALFRNTPRGARAPYRARMRLNFPFDSSPANAYAARRPSGASAQPTLTQETLAKLGGGGALVRVGFILGADGRARNVTVTGRDPNAEVNPALYEAEARNFVTASSFETPPDMPRAGLRSSYMVEFPAGTPAPAATQTTAAASARRNWRWLRRPTGEELEREFPDRAISARRSGEVVLACLVLEEGALNCAVVSENPNGYRFGPAALRVMREARVSPILSNGQSAVGSQITVPIRFEYRESPRAPASGP